MCYYFLFDEQIYIHLFRFRHLEMKFGRQLIKYQIPEWSRYYIAYRALKRLIQAAKICLTEADKSNAIDCNLIE